MDTADPAADLRGHHPGSANRNDHSHAALRITLLGMVCENCNNTWMSRLENRGVKPFLEPMLTNEHVALDAVQQRDLAKWAVMKVLLMEYAMRQRGSHLRVVIGYQPSEPELAWLYRHDDQPPRSRVWFGAFDAGNRQVFTTQSRLMISPPTSAAATQLPAHLATLTIGYVLLQVFSINFVLADKQALTQI